MIRDKKRIENVKVREKKENFVKKFFPTCANSPGGRQYITGVSPARKRAMEKIQNDEDIRTSAKRKLSSNIHFGLGQAKVREKKNQLSDYLVVRTKQLQLTISTQSQEGTRPGTAG